MHNIFYLIECMTGNDRDVSEGGVPQLFFRHEAPEGAPLHCLQDRRELKNHHGR